MIIPDAMKTMRQIRRKPTDKELAVLQAGEAIYQKNCDSPNWGYWCAQQHFKHSECPWMDESLSFPVQGKYYDAATGEVVEYLEGGGI